MDDAFDDRRKALEEQFFKAHNEKLVKKLQDAAQRKATREELTRLTGISNDQVLDALVGLNVGPAAVMMMSVLPLIEVAWADGTIDDQERKVILAQAQALGLQQGSEAALVLARWLDDKPDASWSALWADYVKELAKKLSPQDRAQLEAEVVGRAKRVAEASGKVLGITSGISRAEKKVLDRLAQAFA